MTREERKLWKRECIRSAVLMAALGLVALGLPIGSGKVDGGRLLGAGCGPGGRRGNGGF